MSLKEWPFVLSLSINLFTTVLCLLVTTPLTMTFFYFLGIPCLVGALFFYGVLVFGKTS